MAVVCGMVANRDDGRKNPRCKETGNDMNFLKCFALAVGLFAAVPVLAQDRGPVTNLPLPRYVSLKTDEGNVRRGPSLSHKIDWVFTRRNMPLVVTAEHGHWRRVQDRDGVGGWVHYALISGTRTAIVDHNMLTVHAKADETTPIVAALESGVIVRLDRCEVMWCRVSSGGHRGWALKEALWGIGAGEVLE
jgi:SH3-like domain-containing protein